MTRNEYIKISTTSKRVFGQLLRSIKLKIEKPEGEKLTANASLPYVKGVANKIEKNSRKTRLKQYSPYIKTNIILEN